MKKLNFLAALCCLLLFSCQIENEEIIDKSNADITAETSKSQEGNPFIYGGQGGATEAELFERRLAWASYITGIILYNAQGNVFEGELQPLIDTQTKSIALEDLIGPSAIDAPEFHNAFINLLDHYLNDAEVQETGFFCRPDDPIGGPDEPIVGTGGFCNCDLVQLYLDYVLVENCIELYFPRGIDFINSSDVTTIAHPLDVMGNEGRRRVSCTTNNFIPNITSNYVNQNPHTIIVARPVRDFGNPYCDYEEYSEVSDFRTFLDGPWPLL